MAELWKKLKKYYEEAAEEGANEYQIETESKKPQLHTMN